MTDSMLFPFLSDTAMVLAAGFGKRMMPLTARTPKPLLEVGGRTMLDRALDHIKEIGIRRVIVNAHYLAEQIEEHARTRRDMEVIVSHEKDILDTGGGVINVLDAFGGKPFVVLGGDMPILSGAEPALSRLARAWDGRAMDELLLLYPTKRARGFGPDGDFMLDPNGRVWRAQAPKPRSHVWISAQIVKPELYHGMSERIFSNNLIFDKAEKAGRLYGLEHDGGCYHVGTPEDLEAARRLLAEGSDWT